ncbi:hypothetical protein ZIOFF_065292 [Zingiber officinale]|uniref:Pentatricopeptide repeat-containing protein n=1 Tax=Zingiber officinale TaxID=94328 RepID=A0A8J5KH00_ZINOF|nr:hypothetical protein ZIOFF_065292 [Zingiber officinale]
MFNGMSDFPRDGRCHPPARPSTSPPMPAIFPQSRSLPPLVAVHFIQLKTLDTDPIFTLRLWSDPNLFSHLLNACCLLPSPRSLRLGRQLHTIIAIVGAASFHRFTGNHLFHMYLKLGRVPAARAVFDAMACRNVMSFNILIGGLIHNGDINAARKLFDEMPERNLATWNAMIAGLAHFELDEEGLECFLRSRREGLRSGRQIHAFVVINGFEQDMCVGSSLAHMYMRSGHLKEGERVLRGLPFLNVVSCHTVIAGRAQNGDPEGAFHHFILMKNVGLLSDHVTFLMDSSGADWSSESELELQEMLLGLASSDEFKKNTRIMKEMINDVISKVNKPLSKGEVLWRLMIQLDLDVGRDCRTIREA